MSIINTFLERRERAIRATGRPPTSVSITEAQYTELLEWGKQAGILTSKETKLQDFIFGMRIRKANSNP